MTETMAQPRARSRRAAQPIYALAAAAVLAFGIPLIRHLEDRPRASILVRNDSVWDLSLHVRPDAQSVTRIVTVGAEHERLVKEVLVPGETWEFSWNFVGDEVGVSRVSHADLRQPGFVLVVPGDVEETLRERDAAPAP